MVVDGYGFKFDVRTDILGQLGIKESYGVSYRADTIRLSLTCTVDSKGSIVMPEINNISLGFKPLSDKVSSKDELAKFIRSNKPVFGRLDNMGMIASGVLMFGKDDLSVVSTDEFNFFIPKKVTEDSTLVICDKVSSSSGVNMFKVSEVVLEAYKTALVGCLNEDAIRSREGFLGMFINKEG